MPPTRTVPTAPGQRPTPLQRPQPVKPVKSERTHEENQERAYIAASRRSDRSLEARVESARRASEIHKRRTGRALRVTEADVLNEEMYEEEEDDHYMRHFGIYDPRFRRSDDPNITHAKIMAYYQHQEKMRAMLTQNLQAQGQQRGLYQVPMMFPSMAPGYHPVQQRLMSACPPGYNSQIMYVPNPTHSQGRNMSMHFPQNPQMGLNPTIMMPTGQVSTNPGTPAPNTPQQFVHSPSPVAPMISRPSPSTAGNGSPPSTTTPAGLTMPVSRGTPSASYGAPTPQPQRTDNQGIEQSGFLSADYPFTTQLPGESLRYYQGMQMQFNNYAGIGSDDGKGEFTAKDFASLSPDPNQGWTVAKNQPLPSPAIQSHDWPVTSQDTSESVTAATDSWSNIKTGQLPPTPSTAGLGLQKLETSLSDELPASQSLLATEPSQIATPDGDISSLPCTSAGELDFSYTALWNNQIFGTGEALDEWSQMFSSGDWSQNTPF
ncbi:hypothetical protein EX30DRAFT_349676 [Ascodesmis nigricans]|uniref:Uncharacterized protein n=1 Tax=Ascodesmis nigricans TaxID=341454 RepID=A0A4S2MUR2_9PEZI|nr:hypothetical protein EX30DRAFT_349676 [Ascodesmis nigricans]